MVMASSFDLQEAAPERRRGGPPRGAAKRRKVNVDETLRLTGARGEYTTA